jgi:hypothetical protein
MYVRKKSIIANADRKKGIERKVTAGAMMSVTAAAIGITTAAALNSNRKTKKS